MNSSPNPLNSSIPEGEFEYAVLTSSEAGRDLITRLVKESRSNDYPLLKPVSLPVFTRADFL